MNFEKDNVVMLNGGIEYLIVDTVYYNSNKYLYLSRMDMEEFAIVGVQNKDGAVVLSKLSDEEYSVVLDILNKQNN